MYAFNQMIEFNKANPESKEVYKKMQEWQLKHQPDTGVFCPSEDVYLMSPRLVKTLVSHSRSKSKPNVIDSDMLDLANYLYSLTVFGTWRNTLGVYRMDAEIYNQTINSKIPSDTPTTIFSRLPEWCVYVQLPLNTEIGIGVRNDQVVIDGFWAYFDNQNKHGRKATILNIMINTGEKHSILNNAMRPLQMYIDENLTVEQSINLIYSASDTNQYADAFVLNSLKTKDLELITTFLSQLLWLCAEEPDISNIQGEPVSAEQLRLPKYRRHKKTGAFVPPSQPIVYNIGKRLGGEIRDFNQKYNTSDSRIASRKRPHIRRGHWHGVWKGTGQDKQFSVYWQPAIFVNTTF